MAGCGRVNVDVFNHAPQCTHDVREQLRGGGTAFLVLDIISLDALAAGQTVSCGAHLSISNGPLTNADSRSYRTVSEDILYGSQYFQSRFGFSGVGIRQDKSTPENLTSRGHFCPSIAPSFGF